MDIDNLTKTLAIWGAVTGTIGTIAGIANLIIRYKQHKKDQRKLVCTSDFSFEHYSGDATPKHKIILRSVGKRPVTVDFIRYCIKPRRLWQKLFKNKAWKKERWVHDYSPIHTMQITEGRKEDIKINLPEDIDISEILRVEVHDQSGAIWLVKWPTEKKLKELTYYKKLYNSEESNKNRICKINSYKASDMYYIYIQWNPVAKNMTSFKGKFLYYKKYAEYRQKLKDVAENIQPKLLNCEIDDVYPKQ